MASGLVELLLCSRIGKLHESVLTTKAEPLHIQIALLLLGFEAGRHPVCDKDEKDSRRVGDMVAVFVVLKKGAARETLRGDQTVWDRPENRPMRCPSWVFLGSRVYRGRFCAQQAGSIITTYHDPLAILDNPNDTTKDDTLFFVNEKIGLKRASP